LTAVGGTDNAIFAGSGQGLVSVVGGSGTEAFGGSGATTFDIDGSAGTPMTVTLQKVAPTPANDSSVSDAVSGIDTIAFVKFAAGITVDLSDPLPQHIGGNVTLQLFGDFENDT